MLRETANRQWTVTRIADYIYMTLTQFKARLAEFPAHSLRFSLPDGVAIPPHAHVTEVARVDKRFIDCGGTLRNEAHCQLQIWTASDLEHRLTAGKLSKILSLAEGVLQSEDLELGAEYETVSLSQYTVASTEPTNGELQVQLAARHSACLAEDQCIRPPNPTQSIQFKSRKTLQ